MEQLQAYKVKITERLNRYEKLNELEQQTGVEKFYIVAAISVLLGIFLFVIGGSSLIANLVGFIYPAYQSFKALGTSHTDDDTQWLTYWVVFSFFNLTEQFTDIFLCWIPFYFFLKIGFLVWCYHPSTQGAQILYHSVIKPYIAYHESTIDSALKKASDNAKDVIGKAQ